MERRVLSVSLRPINTRPNLLWQKSHEYDFAFILYSLLAVFIVVFIFAYLVYSNPDTKNRLKFRILVDK